MISTISWERLGRQAGKEIQSCGRGEQPQPSPVPKQSPGCSKAYLQKMKGQRLSGEGIMAFNYPKSSTELLQAGEDFACQGRSEQWPQPVCVRQCLDVGNGCLELSLAL